ncbi:MAG: hypothetical protein A2V93_01840 [Ignavibacteria bacterium RBG_16_34_14]|nr:MAG: hypothetical protein A2V93_01840 [Ignavibacteria bacterium RBG_16_34_14]
MNKNSIHIGTSGWNYKHWKVLFYPEDIPQKKWLEFYCQNFRTVELNNTFYRLPEKKTFETWRDNTPDDFIFSVKASRYITHIKKLNDKEPIKEFLKRAKHLNKKLGPILFQLPPGWKFNEDRFNTFLDMLPEKFQYTFEFRNESWWNEKVIDALKDHNSAFCIFEIAGTLSPKEVTADFIYVRLHGPDEAYQGSYNDKTLKGWANFFSKIKKEGKEIWCYFDNDQNAYAAHNASKLLEMVE